MIGGDIHKFLVKKGITAAKLADLVEITAVQLSRIINGHSMPSRITMEKIARVLDADLSFSTDSGQWSLISKLSGVSIRSMYSQRCDSLHSDSSHNKDILSIPLLFISEIPYSTLQDQEEMDKLFIEASNFMPVPLKDLGRIGPNKPYAVMMGGESMCDAGIPYGAYVAINPDESIYNGDPILVSWGKQEDIAVRWYFKYRDKIELRSSNPIKYPPIILEKTRSTGDSLDISDFFHIYGKVMAAYAKPRRCI